MLLLYRSAFLPKKAANKTLQLTSNRTAQVSYDRSAFSFNHSKA
jgi:hypothetical protein